MYALLNANRRLRRQPACSSTTQCECESQRSIVAGLNVTVHFYACVRAPHQIPEPCYTASTCAQRERGCDRNLFTPWAIALQAPAIATISSVKFPFRPGSLRFAVSSSSKTTWLSVLRCGTPLSNPFWAPVPQFLIRWDNRSVYGKHHRRSRAQKCKHFSAQ